MEYKNLNPLNKITKIIKRGITPKYTANKRINVINQRCIRDGRIDFSPVRFHDDSKKIQEDKILQNYDVLVNSTGVGTLGRVAQFKNISDKIYTVDSHVTILRPIDEIDKIYFGYAIKNKEPFITKMGEGSTGQTELSRDRLGEEVIINVPTLEIQKSIASIMYSLDKKIEVNEKIISNLEEQAQAIFKSWFIDFEPFQDGNFVESELGMIPEGWEVNELKNITNCKLGGTPNRKIKNYWNGNIGWINSGEVNKDRIIEPTEYITLEGLKNSATKLLDKKTTVIAITGATLGQVSLLEIECCTNQSIIGIEQNKDLPYEYLYLFIKNNIARIISNQTGAAQQHINLNDIKTTKIILPTENIMTKYKSITSAFFEKIEKSYFENKKLAEIRDALLPKLMSGEIDVSNIKIKGEEVKNE